MLSVGAFVTRDIDQISVSADPAVTRDYRIDRNGTVSSIPLVATQPTSSDSTPAPSSVAKKPGRPSNKSLGFIASTFTHLDEIIHDLASQTGMTRMQLIARWLGDAKGANSHTMWNLYLMYFAANKETETA